MNPPPRWPSRKLKRCWVDSPRFARGVSVILITHRLQDLFLVCDRIMVMYEGTNVADRRVADTSLSDIVNLIVGENSPPALRPHIEVTDEYHRT